MEPFCNIGVSGARSDVCEARRSAQCGLGRLDDLCNIGVLAPALRYLY